VTAADLAAITARHAAAARVERTTLPAEVLAALADVPVMLCALTPRPAPDALSGVAREALAQAIDADGVRSLDDALVMADDICDPNTGDVERLMRHGCDVAERLAAEVRRLAAHIASEPARVAAAVAVERVADGFVRVLCDPGGPEVAIPPGLWERLFSLTPDEVAALRHSGGAGAVRGASAPRAVAPNEWRVLCEDGTEHTVPVERSRRPGSVLFVARWDGMGWQGFTPRCAVVGVARDYRWDVVEILAPGEFTRTGAVAAAQASAPQPSPDLAAITARHAAAARVERTTLPVEVLAALADVPVMLCALAPQPAPDAPDVAAIGARAAEHTAACDALALVIDDDRIAATGEHDAAFARRDDAAQASAADVPALLAWIASEPDRVAAAVAGERERAVAVCRAVADGWERASVTAQVDTGLALIRAEGATECADALAAPTGGGE
jgi:hypothetical protein